MLHTPLCEARSAFRPRVRAVMASLARRQLLTMAKYGGWANARLHESISNLRESQIDADVKLPFRSIRGTLTHMCLADVMWLGRFTGKSSVHGFQLAEIADLWRKPTNAGQWEEVAVLSSYASVVGMQRQLTDEWVKLVDTLDDAALDGELAYTSTTGKKLTKLRALALTHVFNHATHHRGQITAALTHFGQSAPTLDLVYFLDSAK